MDGAGTVLYVGKAKNLKKRIAQYKQSSNLSVWKKRLVQEATVVKHKVLNSELEAIFIEADLIRQYQPPYNIRLKDDKSPIYIVITSELFPRVLTARRTDLDNKDFSRATVIGPFQSAYLVRKVLRQIRPSFGWCNQAGKKLKTKADWQRLVVQAEPRGCFYQQLGVCHGACVGDISPDEYKKMTQRLKMFLRGKTKSVQRQLKKEIEQHAQNQEFEQAAALKEIWEAVEKLTNPAYKVGPDVALPRIKSVFGQQAVMQLSDLVRGHFELSATWQAKRIEGYDVSNLQGQYATVSMVVFVNGVPSKNNYRIFHIKTKHSPDDYAMLQEALRRRQKHPEWGEPDLILIDGGKGQLSRASQAWQWPAAVSGLAKHPDRLLLPAWNDKSAIALPVDRLRRAGQLLTQVRDESHRFAKKHFQKRWQKRDFS